MKIFRFGVICSRNLKKIEGCQTGASDQLAAQRTQCREILFNPRCSPRARKFPISGQFFALRTVSELYGASKSPNCRILHICSMQNAQKVTFSARPTAHVLHCRMIPIILCCGSGRTKRVPLLVFTYDV